MSPQEGTAWQVGVDASEVLGPESSVFAQVDPVDFGSSVLSVLGRAAGHPDEVGGAWLRFGAAVAGAGPAAVARWLGSDREPPVPVRFLVIAGGFISAGVGRMQSAFLASPDAIANWAKRATYRLSGFSARALVKIPTASSL